MLTLRRSISVLAALLLPIQGGAGQSGESIDLADLSAFQAAAANWSTAGGAWADPGTEHSLEALAGEGVLVNRPTPAARDNLLSRFEHGDADLELQSMMARGSNSGIYLQGRYEIQLLDSWGETQPRYSDCGGVYQRRRAETAEREAPVRGNKRRSGPREPGIERTHRRRHRR